LPSVHRHAAFHPTFSIVPACHTSSLDIASSWTMPTGLPFSCPPLLGRDMVEARPSPTLINTRHPLLPPWAPLPLYLPTTAPYTTGTCPRHCTVPPASHSGQVHTPCLHDSILSPQFPSCSAQSPTSSRTAPTWFARLRYLEKATWVPLPSVGWSFLIYYLPFPCAHFTSRWLFCVLVHLSGSHFAATAAHSLPEFFGCILSVAVLPPPCVYPTTLPLHTLQRRVTPHAPVHLPVLPAPERHREHAGATTRHTTTTALHAPTTLYRTFAVTAWTLH